MNWRWLLPLLACLSCSQIPAPAQRRGLAVELAGAAGWHPESMATGRFSLTAFVPDRLAGSETLHVYIEGDGLAWLDRHTPSADPTPLDPLALRLALRDPAPAVYLARPCQFSANAGDCTESDWTSRRYSPEVLDALSQAIDLLKRRYGSRHFVLIGYSGGGALALLLAARRDDVRRVVSVAGNLDHAAWTARHRLAPLDGSLNPADFRERLQGVSQLHYVGGRDRVMMEAVAQSYAVGFPAHAKPPIVVIPEFDHGCCWAERWPLPGLAGD